MNNVRWRGADDAYHMRQPRALPVVTKDEERQGAKLRRYANVTSATLAR